MDLFEALVDRPGPANLVAACAGLLGTAAVDTWHGELARVAARGGPGSWSHSLARHAFSMLWGWADITLWKGEAEQDHVQTCGRCLTVFNICKYSENITKQRVHF